MDGKNDDLLRIQTKNSLANPKSHKNCILIRFGYFCRLIKILEGNP